MQDQETPDYYQVEALLTEPERKIRNRVRRFVDDACMPIIAGHFDQGTFPMNLIPQMVEMGLFGLQMDGYGGAGSKIIPSMASSARNWDDVTVD